MTKRKRDTMLVLLESNVRAMLTGPDAAKLNPSEKLKAIDAGARLLMIRHKIEDKGSQDGSFFGTSK